MFELVETTMNKILLMMTLLFCTLTSCFAQENRTNTINGPLSKHFMFDIDFGGGLPNKGMKQLTFSGQVGYKIIPRMYVFVKGEGMTGLHKADNGMKTWTQGSGLGGGIGFRLVDVVGLGIDLKGTVLTTVGNADWKNTSYEGKVVFSMGTKLPIRPTFGIGFRHTDSRTAGIADYNGMVATIGISF